MAAPKDWRSTITKPKPGPYRPSTKASLKETRKMLLKAGHPMFVKQAKEQRARHVRKAKDAGTVALVGAVVLGTAFYLAHKSKTSV